MKKWIYLSLCVLLAAAGVACSDDDGGGNSRGTYSEDITHEEFADEYFRLVIERGFCEIPWNCEQPVRDLAVGKKFSSEQACVDTLTSDLGEQTEVGQDLARNQRLVDAGELDFDSAKGAACLDLIAGAGPEELCNNTFYKDSADNPCESMYTGLTAAGEPCITSNQCADEDAYCDRANESCVGSCTVDDWEDTCGNGPACADGEYCNRDAETPTCEPTKSDGDACTGWDECGDGLDCVTPQNSDQGTCVRENSVTEGGTCEYNDHCNGDLICAEGSCQQFSYVQAGGECDLDKWNGDPCVPGTVCHLDSPDNPVGTCKAPAGVGEACSTWLTCAWGLYCDRSSADQPGTCAQLKADGTACESGSECESDYCTSSGTCGEAQACQLP